MAVSELKAHCMALASESLGLNCVVCSELTMMVFPIRPISFVRPIMAGEGGTQAVCAMIKLKVGSGLGSTIDHLVVLCSYIYRMGGITRPLFP